MEKGTVIVDKTGGTIFIALEDHEHSVGVGEEGPDEVFADMGLFDRGIQKIVAFHILDIEQFDPADLERYDYMLSDEQKDAVRKAYMKAINS